MVQGDKQCASSSSMQAAVRDPAARKAGFEAIQRKEQEKDKKAKEQQTNKYGAWGPVYKNKDNFVNMHWC